MTVNTTAIDWRGWSICCTFIQYILSTNTLSHSKNPTHTQLCYIQLLSFHQINESSGGRGRRACGGPGGSTTDTAVRVVSLHPRRKVLLASSSGPSLVHPASLFSLGRGNSRAREEIGCRFLQGIVQGAQEVLGIFLGDFDNVGIEGYIIG